MMWRSIHPHDHGSSSTEISIMRLDYDQAANIDPMPNIQNFFNTYIGSQLLKMNPDSITRVQTVRSIFNPYAYHRIQL